MLSDNIMLSADNTKCYQMITQITSADNMLLLVGITIFSVDNTVLSANNTMLSADKTILSDDNTMLFADNKVLLADNMVILADYMVLSSTLKFALFDTSIL
jgi:hypothetical protein